MSDTETTDAAYSRRLSKLSGSWWKRALDVQRPYRWNLQRLRLGIVLDVGCGIGRNLAALATTSVGVDHNPTSVAEARERKLKAYTPAEFHASTEAVVDRFDTLLFSHVLEHMDAASGNALIAEYLPYLKPAGRLVFITPQEKGFKSDATHVRFVGFSELASHAERAGCIVTKAYSFPLPRIAGAFFTYNEFVVVAESV